ncbi:MAG: hypothetical protein JSV62_12120 [Promethearchaeota archaeon]|nr:MAG: hypothetical protein JSV62_12120 [Candidatus Lokiarchaeota archaeon]
MFKKFDIQKIEVKFICPICSAEKKIAIPTSIILEGKEDLTTMFIDKGMICNHQFQVYINKDFKIQDYLIIDQDYID